MKTAEYRRFMAYIWLVSQYIEFHQVVVLAFSTAKCNHDEIEARIEDTFDCSLWSLNNNIDKYNTTPNLTVKDTNITHKSSKEKIINELYCCIVANFGHCFKEKEFNKVMLLSYNYIKNLSNRDQIICHEGVNTEKGQSNSLLYVSKSYIHEDIPGLLVEIIKADENCTKEDSIKFINVSLSCLQNYMMAEMRQLLSFMIEFPSDHVSSMSVRCSAIVNGLNTCFEKEKCLSMQEINLIKNSFATFYKVAMSYVTKTFEIFRGNPFHRFKQKYLDDENNVWNPSLYNQTEYEKTLNDMNKTIRSFEVYNTKKLNLNLIFESVLIHLIFFIILS